MHVILEGSLPAEEPVAAPPATARADTAAAWLPELPLVLLFGGAAVDVRTAVSAFFDEDDGLLVGPPPEASAAAAAAPADLPAETAAFGVVGVALPGAVLTIVR